MSEIQNLDDQTQVNDQQNESQFGNTFQSVPFNQTVLGGNSVLQQYESPPVEQQVLNKIETLGKTISQVLAIEKFKQFTNKTRGCSIFLLQNEISEQRRNFVNLQQDCLTNGIQEEFQKAKEEFKRQLKLLEDLLQLQEHKSLLQNILQPPPAQSCILIQPDMKFIEALENYHYQSQINFHNSLQIDKTGQDLLGKINTYSKELSKFLYFKFIEQGIKNLDQLLNYVLMNKTQNNQITLQLLNDYIRQLRSQNDKQQLLNEIQLIIVVFPELAEYFQELQTSINDEDTYFDDRIELKSIQFDIVMLIFDHVINPKRVLNRKLSDKTIGVMRQLYWIYKDGSVQTMQKLQRDLRRYIQQNHSQALTSDLEYLSDLFISTKLRLLIKMLLLTTVMQDSDIKYEYFHFQIFSYHDQDLIQQCLRQGEGDFQNVYHEPSIDEQQMKIQSTINQFSQVIEFAVICEMDLNKNIQNTNLEDLKCKIKDSIQSLGNEIKQTKTIIKLQVMLNQIFWFQHLNQKTFGVLYQYLQELNELELKNKGNFGNEELVPNLYQLLLNFELEKQKEILFKNKIKEITEQISEDYVADFNDLVKEIQQFDPNNEAGFIKNVKQYYYQDFKAHLLNLAELGTKQFKEATHFLIQKVHP